MISCPNENACCHEDEQGKWIIPPTVAALGLKSDCVNKIIITDDGVHDKECKYVFGQFLNNTNSNYIVH